MLDLEKIRREWLNPCGPCDFGLVEFGCTCPDGDYRNVILALLDELDKTRAELDEAKAEQGRIAQRMAAALEPYVGTYTIRQALADANPATTAEPDAEDAEDAPCKTCGKPWRNRRHECEPADEPKAVSAEWIEAAKATIASAGPIVPAASEAEPAAS